MTDHNEAMRLAEQLKKAHPNIYVGLPTSAAAMLIKQAERIAELEARVHTCGPQCSKAGCINRRVTAERDQLRAEVERLRVDAERLDWLQQAMSEGDEKVPDLCTDTGEFYFNYTHNGQIYCDGCSFDLRCTLDHARTTHKDPA